MSLINDALKRAKQSQQNNPPTGVGPLPPVEPPRGGGSGWMLGLAAILFLAAAGLFVGVAIFKHQGQPTETAKAPAVSAPPPSQTQPAPAPTIPVAVPISAPTQAPVAKPVPAPPPLSNAMPAKVATNLPPVAPAEQLPRIQGIIYNSARPIGIVNGKTVYVGDFVGNFQVKQILKSSIVFQRPDGSRKTLNIGE